MIRRLLVLFLLLSFNTFVHAGESIIHYRTSSEINGNRITFTISIDNAGNVAIQRLTPTVVFENQLYVLPILDKLDAGAVYYQALTVESHRQFASKAYAILNVNYFLDAKPMFYTTLMASNTSNVNTVRPKPFKSEFLANNGDGLLLIESLTDSPASLEVFAAVPVILAAGQEAITRSLLPQQKLVIPLDFKASRTPMDGQFHIAVLFTVNKKCYADYLSIDIAKATHVSLAASLLSHTMALQVIALLAFAVFVSTVIGAIISNHRKSKPFKQNNA